MKRILSGLAAAVICVGIGLAQGASPMVPEAQAASGWGPGCTASQTGEKKVDYQGVDLDVLYVYARNCGTYHITRMSPSCGGLLFTCAEHQQGVIGSDYSNDQTAWYNQNINYYAGVGSDSIACRVFLRGSPGADPNVTGWCSGHL